MASTDTAFAGSIPEIYERLLVPLIFETYARDLAARVLKTGAQSVLETAAGTGVLTRALAAKLPVPRRIVATDLNPGMLKQAATLLPPEAKIVWRQADALDLPFADQSFDAVLCQFGVMFFPDKTKGYAEARRVLKPGGHFFFNVWDRISENQFADAVTEALASVFPDDPPRFLARIPHGYHDPDTIRKELRTAGFSSISIETRSDVARAPSAREPATAYCQGTPLRAEIEARDTTRLLEATQKASEAIAAKFGRDAVESQIRALVVTAS
jgi:ubiquinone/menaquinone biosynthesis C-methylase UbiE